MSDIQKPNVFVDNDPDELEASLSYKRLAKAKEEERRNAAKAGLGTEGTAGNSSGAAKQASAAVSSGGGSSLGALPIAGMSGAAGVGVAGATASREELRFTNDQLIAETKTHEEDPWGAYGDMNVAPAPEDEEERRKAGAGTGGLALKGSGARGGGVGGSSPMMPMGGIGMGAGVNSGVGAPGASIAGVGGSPMAMAPQLPIGGAGGPLTMSSLAAFNAQKATGAYFAPMSSGVMAAGYDLKGADPSATQQFMLNAGLNTGEKYIAGPDGNLYDNPYYRDPSRSTLPELEAWDPNRSHSASPHVGGDTLPGGAYNAGLAGAGAAPGRGGDNAAAYPVDGIRGRNVGSGYGTEPPNSAGGGLQPPAAADGSASSDSPDLTSAAYKEARRAAVADRTFGGFSQPSPPSQGSSGPITSSGGEGGYSSQGIDRSAGARPRRGYGDEYEGYTVVTSELRSESREWARVGEGHKKVVSQVDQIPKATELFTILQGLVTPYSQAKDSTVKAVSSRARETEDNAVRMEESAVAYDKQEEAGAAISEGAGR